MLHGGVFRKERHPAHAAGSRQEPALMAKSARRGGRVAARLQKVLGGALVLMILLVLLVDRRSQNAGGNNAHTDKAEPRGKRSTRHSEVATDAIENPTLTDLNLSELRGAVGQAADAAHRREHAVAGVLRHPESTQGTNAFHEVKRSAYKADRAIRCVLGEAGHDLGGCATAGDKPETVRKIRALLQQPRRGGQGLEPGKSLVWRALRRLELLSVVYGVRKGVRH